MNRLKYKLLRWLLGDICTRSNCEQCRLRGSGRYSCKQNDIYPQARRVWRIK